MLDAARLRRRGTPTSHEDLVKERTRRTAVKSKRNQKAQDAWEKWTDRPRNKFLQYHSALKLCSTPTRLLKKDGYTKQQITKIRDRHQVPCFRVALAPTEAGPTTFEKIAAFVSTTFAIFLSLLVPVLLSTGPWLSEPYYEIYYSVLGLAAVIASATAFHAMNFDYGDFQALSAFLLSLIFPPKTKKSSKKLPDDGSPDGDPSDGDSSDSDPVRSSGRGGRLAGTKRALESSDDDDDTGEPPERETKKSKGTNDNDGENDEEDGAGDEDGGDDESEDTEEQFSSSKTKSRKGRKKAPLHESQESEADEEFKREISLILQTNDPDLKNTRRIAENLKKAKIARVVKPLKPDGNEAPLSEVLARSSMSGRDYRPLKMSKVKAKEHQFTFADHTVKANSEAKGTTITVPFTTLAGDTPTSDLTKVHQELARIYNTFPFDVAHPPKAMKDLWVGQACTSVLGHPKQLKQVNHNARAAYLSDTFYINSDTGKPEILNFKVTGIDSVMDSVSVPPLPPLNLWRQGFTALMRRDPAQPRYIAQPDPKSLKLAKKAVSSRQSQCKAEDVIYWLALQTQGMIATKDRMTEIMVQLKEQIGLSKGRTQKGGIYGGESDLYNHHTVPAELTTRLHPTKKVARDMGMEHQAVRLVIYSLNASRVTQVMETLVQLFFNGDDLRQVWLEGAKTADLVNQDIASGVAPHSACDCDDVQTGTEMHVCEGCAKPTLCKTRSYDSLGRLVCAACFKRDQVSRDNSRFSGETFVAYMARISLWRNFRKECVAKNKDPQSKKYKSIYNAAWKNLKATLPGQGNKSSSSATQQNSTKFLDVYTGKHFDIGQERGLVGNNPSQRRWVPNGITVDAVHGQGEPANVGLKHSGKNTVITTDAVQLAKGRFLPGVTHEIGKFLRDPQKALDSSQRALVERINEMTLVLLKRPYIQNGKGSDEDKYAQILAESVSGKSTPGEQGPWQALVKRYISAATVAPYNPAKPRSSVWSKDIWQRSQACAESMEKYFGVKLYKLKDGTRWMGSSWSNPSDFDRNSIATL